MDLRKDQAKEGAGHRQMDMRKRTLSGPESKEDKRTSKAANLVPFGDVVGCLAVHIKNCSQFAANIDLQHYNNFCIRITISNIVKCTKMGSLLQQNIPYINNEMKTMIQFNEVKYFSIQVPRRQNDVRNNIYLDLMQYDSKEKHNILLGRVQVHLYEVIQKGCFTEEFQMMNENTFICQMEVEFLFSYGNFGYGFSHQLKPLQKIVEPSMFMNIAPPPERTDPVTNTIIPQPIEYPAFLSSDLNVSVGMPASVDKPPVVLEKLQQPPRERLEKMKKEYRNLQTWKEKAMYLEGVLTPKLEDDEPKGSNTNEVPESQFEKKPEDTVTSDASPKNEEPETIPTKLMDNDDKKDLTSPTSNQMDQDYSNDVTPKPEESTKQRTAPLFTIPDLTITEGNTMVPLEEHQPEAATERKLNRLFQPDANLPDQRPSILKTDSSASESSRCSSSIPDDYTKFPTFRDDCMQDRNYGWLNTNKKGKSVAFLQKQLMELPLRPEFAEFKPKYQNFGTKDGLDPFLWNTNNKMSVCKMNDQDMFKCGNFLSSEIIEHEDQDPPYPTRSKTPSTTDKTWPDGLESSAVDTKPIDTETKLAGEPDIIPIQTVNTERNLPCDPSTTTIKGSHTENPQKERLPNASLPNFKGPSSLTGNVDTCRLSKSLSLASLLENLKQSVVFKPGLSKTLLDLLDKLFPKPEIPNDTDAREKSHSPSLASVHDVSPSSLEHQILEKVQDLSNWLPIEEILNSESLVNPIIKDSPRVLLSEDGPGNSPEVERELVPEKHVEVSEVVFPMKKKSSFKKKHLEMEAPSSTRDYKGIPPDYIIKQIFTTPLFSKLKIGVEEPSEAQMNWQNQLPTAWESFSSDISVPQEESDDDGRELLEAKSVVSQIMQAFPVDTLLESGIVKVVELDEKSQKSALLDTETGFAGEKPKDSTEDYSGIKSKTDSLSKQNIPFIPRKTTPLFSIAKFIDKSQNTSPQDSKYQSTPDEKTDLPHSSQRLDREENDLSSTLDNLSNLLMGKLNESDVILLKSFFKNISDAFLKPNQSEKRSQPEKKLERLIEQPLPNNAEDLEEIKENSNKANLLDRKPSLNPKLRVFLEALSESEIKKLKSELSKHIQHYLIERLSESGHITEEDLSKIYQNLYLMNEKTKPKGQNVFPEKHSEIVKEMMSFVNNFNHHFIDKNLEIRLKSFLNEILQNYFLKNLSESSLFKETESEPMPSNTSPLRTKSAGMPFRESGQDIPKGSFGTRLEINMKYPVNKSLQNYLVALPENELLNLKADLSKYLQMFFIDKLSKSGLITEKQLQGISNHINLKCIKPDLPFRDENQLRKEHSEKQNKYSKNVQKATLQKAPEDRVVETELNKKEEKECFPLQNIKENQAIIKEQKILTFVKVQSSSNKNSQAIPSKKSLERPASTVLKKQRKEHGVTQLPGGEHFDFQTEIRKPPSRSGKSTPSQSSTCFENTLKMKSPGKKEHKTYKLMQEQTEAALSPYPRTPYCKTPSEDEYVEIFKLPPRQNNTSAHFNSEAGENSKSEDPCWQRLKGYNNNNKKQPLVKFAHYEKEILALYTKPSEICSEKCAKVPESQSFKYKVVEAEKNSKPSLFPEVLKRENLKPKVQKERDHVSKQKKSPTPVKTLATTPPSTRALRKPVPKTLPHWTARKTIHDCSDRFEDYPMNSFQHLEKVRSRARLLEKSPDESHDRLKHPVRPSTAPGGNKHRESYSAKCKAPAWFQQAQFT